MEDLNRRLIGELKKIEVEVQKLKNIINSVPKEDKEVQVNHNYSDTGTQPNSVTDYNERMLAALFSENPPNNVEFSETSSDEGENQNENQNINSFPDYELAFLRRNLDSAQLGDIEGSVGGQFRTTQLDANILCTDKNPWDPNYLDSMHHFSLKIFGLNGSDQMPGSVTYSKVTISGSHDGLIWTKNITDNQNLSDSLTALVISAISDRSGLEYLRVGLREVGVSI